MNSTDFLSPKGDLELEWFPEEEDVNSRIDGYIQEGTDKAGALSGETLTAAVSAWVYHRAYRAIWVRLSANPNSVTFNDQGSRSYNQSQINSFADLARDYLMEFNSYIAEIPATARASITTSVPNTYVF